MGNVIQYLFTCLFPIYASLEKHFFMSFDNFVIRLFTFVFLLSFEYFLNIFKYESFSRYRIVKYFAQSLAFLKNPFNKIFYGAKDFNYN